MAATLEIIPNLNIPVYISYWYIDCKLRNAVFSLIAALLNKKLNLKIPFHYPKKHNPEMTRRPSRLYSVN